MKGIKYVGKTPTMQCKCDHAYQDEKYGAYNRVIILIKGKTKDKESSGDRAVCTVCGKEIK